MVQTSASVSSLYKKYVPNLGNFLLSLPESSPTVYHPYLVPLSYEALYER
jgi:hypothetical protein